MQCGMNKSQSKKHYNELIREIAKYKPDLKFKITRCGDKITLDFYKNNARICLSPWTAFDEVRRRIDGILSGRRDICGICSGEGIKVSIVACSQCAGEYCYDCLFNLIRSGHGMIICPYCRYETGERLETKNEVDYKIWQILMRETARRERMASSYEHFFKFYKAGTECPYMDIKEIESGLFPINRDSMVRMLHPQPSEPSESQP